MAFGFTPKHIEEFELEELPQDQFLTIAVETARKLNWTIQYVSKSGMISYTNKGMFSRNAEIKITVENGIATVKSSSTGSEMIDMGSNKKYVQKFMSTFDELLPIFTNEELALKQDEIKSDEIFDEKDSLNLPPPSTSSQIFDLLGIFKPTRDYFVTPILFDLNVLVFLLMVISGINFFLPDSTSLLNWGANFRPMTLEGEWWRLITNCFLHIGIFHLLMNMYALYFIGILLEPVLGRVKFISAYLLTGITASISSIWWHDLTISAGASGAIFGLYGVFLALLTTNLIEKTKRKALLASIGIFVMYNLLYGMKDGIDNAAHFGGLIGGFIIGYCFVPSLKKPDEEKLNYSAIGILTVVIFVSSFFVLKSIPNDIGKYDKQMQTFVSNETIALEVFKMPQSTPKDSLLYSLKDRGINIWKENIRLINDVDKLNLPEVIHLRNNKLKQYCELRVKSYELICQSLEQNSQLLNDNIEEYNQQIQSLINELKNN